MDTKGHTSNNIQGEGGVAPMSNSNVSFRFCICCVKDRHFLVMCKYLFILQGLYFLSISNIFYKPLALRQESLPIFKTS